MCDLGVISVCRCEQFSLFVLVLLTSHHGYLSTLGVTPHPPQIPALRVTLHNFTAVITPAAVVAVARSESTIRLMTLGTARNKE